MVTIATITLNPCIDKSLSVDHVVPDRKLKVKAVHRYPGGGGINVARVIGRLGGKAQALWSCGGRNGEVLSDLLDEEGVDHRPITIEKETRENLIITDESDRAQYRFGVPGPGLSERERFEWIARIRDWPEAPPYAVFSGSVPEEVSLDWYGELLRALPSQTRVVVDTKKRALVKALEQGVYLVKPNIHELEEAVGRELGDDAQIIDASREIIERGGAEVVLVSLGRGGAVLVTSVDARRLSAPAVKIRSKVGAGDSMVGGLVFALARGRSLADAAKMAVAAGAAAVMTDGTDLCHREDVERLYERVERER
jgi:6-phosphofructokinase 2